MSSAFKVYQDENHPLICILVYISTYSCLCNINVSEILKLREETLSLFKSSCHMQINSFFDVGRFSFTGVRQKENTGLKSVEVYYTVV